MKEEIKSLAYGILLILDFIPSTLHTLLTDLINKLYEEDEDRKIADEIAKCHCEMKGTKEI